MLLPVPPSEAPPPSPCGAGHEQQQRRRRRQRPSLRRRPCAASAAALSMVAAAAVAVTCHAFFVPPPLSPSSPPLARAAGGGGSSSGGLVGRRAPIIITPQSPPSSPLAYALRDPSSAASAKGGKGRVVTVEEVEALLAEVERMQSRAFKETGILGRPFPISAMERFKAEGRLGTAPERDALAKARDVGAGEGQVAMLEALRLRAMAKRLRAEADLAEVELANEKVNATVRATLAGMDVGMELLKKPRSGAPPADPASPEAALDVARRAFSRLLALEASVPPPLSTVERRADEVEVDVLDDAITTSSSSSSSMPPVGQRPSWIRDDDWDDDFPDLTIGSSNAPAKPKDEREKEDASLMGAGKKKTKASLLLDGSDDGGSGAGGRQPLSAQRLQDEFLKEVQGSSDREEGQADATAAAAAATTAAAANETAPAPAALASSSSASSPLEGAGKPQGEGQGQGEEEEEEEETFFSIGTNASDIGIIAYELVGTLEPLPGLPDVKFRRIRRKELNPDESFQRALGAIQQMIENEAKANPDAEGGLLDLTGGQQQQQQQQGQSQDDGPPLAVNLTALMLDDEDEPGRVKDGLLESFLQSNFPDEEVPALPEENWQTLRSEVFGKNAGGAFTLSYVVDFDSRFHVMVGDVGTTPSGAPLSSQALASLLNKRLEYFNLTDTVSLFFLRFPPETLFELEDIAMDAAMDSFDDDALGGGGGGDDGIGGGRGDRRGGAGLDEDGMMIDEGVDLRLMGELVPRFLGKLAQGRFAILALPKRTAPDDSSVLDDPVVRASTLAMGALLQTSETLRYVSPPLFERLDRDLPGFLMEAAEFPALTQGVPPVLVPLAVLILAHEAGHWVAAKRQGVKLGAFVPILDPWFGYLGSLTQLESYPPTRQALFDVAAAGPLLGSLASYAAFLAGLWLTKLGALPEFSPSLPIQLLTASTFLADMTNAVLPGAFAVVDPENAALSLHPLALAGYWGVMFNALNLLPLGRLDGARMVEALLGKRTAAAASSFTFWGTVAAGLWQGRPDLFFAGLVVRFFWHRKAVPCRDEVADVGGERYFLGIAGLILLLGAFIPATDRFVGDATYLLNNL